ncbi:peptidylprolyl isomerase [Halovulum sp. GXIMD14793]
MRQHLAALTTAFALAFSGPTVAQNANPFEPALIVNERAITHFELEQRTLLLLAFGAGGDVRDLAREQLIGERLQLQAADSLGIELTTEQLDAGFDEFATRRNLTQEQVLGALSARGIAPETIMDFLEAGLTWRAVIQARFRPLATPSESDLDAALDFASRGVQESVLLQELSIPFGNQDEAQIQDLARRLSRELNRGGNFNAAVSRYSRAASRARGGRLGWVAASSLPPPVAGQVLALQPGEVTAPIPIQRGVTILKLLDYREEPRSAQESGALTVTYSQLIIPLPANASAQAEAAARKQAETIRRDARFCLDLDEKADEFGFGSGRSEPTPANAVPQDIALLLSGMDAGDIEIQRDSRGVVLVMLCGRSDETSPEEREALRRRLFNERMQTFAQGYLQELRGDAVIEEK